MDLTGLKSRFGRHYSFFKVLGVNMFPYHFLLLEADGRPGLGSSILCKASKVGWGFVCLVLRFKVHEDSDDYIGPTQATQEDLSVSSSLIETLLCTPFCHL